MSFGGGLGDVIKLVELTIASCHLWQHARGDMEGLRDDLGYLKEELAQLDFPEDLLDAVGHEQYPYAKSLENDLQKHKAYLDKYQWMSGEKNTWWSKFTDHAKLAAAGPTVNGIKENIQRHLNHIRDFRLKLILAYMSGRTRSYWKPKSSVKSQGRRPTSRPNASPIANRLDIPAEHNEDHISVLYKVAQAYEIGQMMTSTYSSSGSGSSLTEISPTSSTKKFAREILEYRKKLVDLTLKYKLYTGDLSSDAHAEVLRRIAELWDNFSKLVESSPDSIRSMRSSSIHQSPMSSVFDPLADIEHDDAYGLTPPSSLVAIEPPYEEAGPSEEISSRWPNRRTSMTLSPTHRKSPTIGSSLRHCSDGDGRSNESSLDPMSRSAATIIPVARPLDIEGNAFVSSPVARNTALQCHLSVRNTEAGAVIEAKLVSEGRTKALVPRDILFDRAQTPAPTAPGSSLVFKHYVAHPMDSFPCIQHPSIDTLDPHIESAPYSIYFIRRQILEIQHSGGNKQESSILQYFFQNRQDREMMRAILFGKRLLASVGVDEVCIDKELACRSESLSIWEHEAADVEGGLSNISITLPYYAREDRSTPERIVEFLIRDHSDFPKALHKAKKQHERLRIDVRRMPETDELGTGPRQGSVSTATTAAGSTKASSVGSSIFRSKNDVTSVYIKFSEPDGKKSFRDDKKRFLNALIERYGPPEQTQTSH